MNQFLNKNKKFAHVLKCRVTRTSVLVFLFFYIVLLIGYIIFLRTPYIYFNNVPTQCFHRQKELVKEHYLSELTKAKKTPQADDNIFFINSDCDTNDGNQYGDLTVKEACAVESAAMHNPNSTVYVIFLRQVQIPRNTPWMRNLLSYGNVELRNINMMKFFYETDFNELITLTDSIFSQNNTKTTSQVLHFMLLMRWGGVSLDLSVVTMSSFDNLPFEDVFVQTNENKFNNKFMKASVEGPGHDLLANMMEQIITDIVSNINGVDVIKIATEVLEKYCKNNLRYVMECVDIYVLPAYSLYELTPGQWKDLTAQRFSLNLKSMDRSVMFSIPPNVRELSAFKRVTAMHILMAKNCPKVFAAYKNLKK